MLTAVTLIGFLVHASAPPPVDSKGAPKAFERPTVAVLPFETQEADADKGSGLVSILASRLSQSGRAKVLTQADFLAILGAERQRQMLQTGNCGEADGQCMAELSGAVGARYLVSGRLDRFGSKWVVTATLYDSQRSEMAAKPSVEVDREEAIPSAARQVADELVAALPPEPPPPEAATESKWGTAAVSVKFGSQFLVQLLRLNPGADLELAWRFDPEWMALIQLGFNFVRASDEGQERQLTVLPGVLGLRKLYRIDSDFQPYWGLGLGLQLSIGQFGFFSDTESFPTVVGLLGFHYMVTKRFGLVTELSTNIAQMVLGLRSGGAGKGLNFDISVGAIYRFE